VVSDFHHTTKMAAAHKTAVVQVLDQEVAALLRAQLVRLGADALVDQLFGANDKVKAGFSALVRHASRVALYGSAPALQEKAALSLASKKKQWAAAMQDGASDVDKAAEEAEAEKAQAAAQVRDDQLAQGILSNVKECECLSLTKSPFFTSLYGPYLSPI